MLCGRPGLCLCSPVITGACYITDHLLWILFTSYPSAANYDYKPKHCATFVCFIQHSTHYWGDECLGVLKV